MGAEAGTPGAGGAASEEPSSDVHLVEVGGRYLDRFERREGAWRIHHRAVVIDWSRVATIEAGFDAQGYLEGARKPLDPSYAEDG